MPHDHVGCTVLECRNAVWASCLCQSHGRPAHQTDAMVWVSSWLDATAQTSARFLRQYPLGRLGVFGYLVGIHIFIWVLISHMQHAALDSEHRHFRSVTEHR